MRASPRALIGTTGCNATNDLRTAALRWKPERQDGHVSDRYSRTPRERNEGYLRVLETRRLSTSPDRLRELAWDPIPPVRLWASGNPNMPPDVLDELVRSDETGWVLFNPSAPESALRFAAERERQEQGASEHPFIWVRALCYMHPNAGRAFRRELRKQGVKRAVLARGRRWRGRAQETHSVRYR